MNIQYYLINLDESVGRLAQATKQLGESLNIERVAAFDGRQLDPLTFSKYDDQKAMNYMGRAVNGGEIGCFMSHLNSAELFLQSDADYGVVLEDDMKIPNAQTLEQSITEILYWLESQAFDWYLINIGANKNKLYSKLAIFDEFELRHAHYFPMLTTGLIWSRKGAREFIAHATNIYCPVDNFFRDWLTDTNKGLAVWPPLVTTTGAESVIDGHNSRKLKELRAKNYGYLKQKRLWVDKFKAVIHKFKN